MSVSLSPLAKMQFNQSGIPLAGGLLFTYVAGTAATKLNTYTDSTGGTPNTNPIILDANGQCSLWLSDNLAYKFVLCPSTDNDPPTNPYWTQDYISNVPSSSPTFTTLTVTGNVTVGGTINKVTITQPATGATLTLANNSTLATVGAFSTTFTTTGTTAITLPTSGTLAVTTQATDTFGALSDITTNNVSATAHGFIPKFPNNTTTFFRGDGTYSPVPGISLVRSARTSNTILGVADNSTFVDITSGTFSQTFTAAATLATGWFCYVRNSGSGVITLDPNASELIDGLTSYPMYPGECRLIQCDGSAFTTIIVSPFSNKFTSTFTFVKPPGYNGFWVSTQAGGAGGGSGGANNVGANRAGGAGGAGGERRPFEYISASAIAASITVTVGAKGVGGASVSSANNGNNGTAGGSSNFGGLLTSNGGSLGVGGTGSANAGGAGNGSTSRPSWMTPSTENSIGSVGGQPNGAGAAGAGSEWGGAAGGGSHNDATTAGIGGTSTFAGSGGGGGGGLAAGGPFGLGAAGGTGAGAGGDGSATGVAGSNATSAGGGGGGGGASSSGLSGKGGDGADGFVIIEGA